MICLEENHSTNISVNFCQNISNEIAINLNFHFSHCKSMETLSFLKVSIATKEANVRNNFANFQFCLSHSF